MTAPPRFRDAVRASGFEQILARENADHLVVFPLNDRNTPDTCFDNQIGNNTARRVGIGNRLLHVRDGFAKCNSTWTVIRLPTKGIRTRHETNQSPFMIDDGMAAMTGVRGVKIERIRDRHSGRKSLRCWCHQLSRL